MRQITVALLRAKGVNARYIAKFIALGGDDRRLTEELCVRYAWEFDFDWGARHLLLPKAIPAYERAEKLAGAQRESILKPAWAEWAAAQCAADAELQPILKPAHAKFAAVQQPAWKKFQSIQQSAYKKLQKARSASSKRECKRIRKAAMAEYDRVQEPAWLQYLADTAEAAARYSRAVTGPLKKYEGTIQTAEGDYRRACARAFFRAWVSEANQSIESAAA